MQRALMQWCNMIAFTALVCTACQKEAKEDPPFSISIAAFDDEDQPLAGVHVQGDAVELGYTSSSGALTVQIKGTEGTSLAMKVTCPEGYALQGETPPIVLRRFQTVDPKQNEKGMEYAVRCAALEHLAAILVRAKNQAGLPVLVHGKEMARTDESGVAHIVVRGAPGTVFRVSINTASNPLLRPQNPSNAFTVAKADDFFIFDQGFAVYKPPKPKARAKAKPLKRPTYPMRIQ